MKITVEQIPDEAWRAAMNTDPREGLAAAIVAALKAWPGRALASYAGETCHILPLPQEPQ